MQGVKHELPTAKGSNLARAIFLPFSQQQKVNRNIQYDLKDQFHSLRFINLAIESIPLQYHSPPRTTAPEQGKRCGSCPLMHGSRTSSSADLITVRKNVPLSIVSRMRCTFCTHSAMRLHRCQWTNRSLPRKEI